MNTLQIFAKNNVSSGLYFQSHEVSKENRTSLDLNPEGDFIFPDGFILDFEIKFRSEEHNYGYIFRIIVNDTLSFDLISNMTQGKKSLSLVEGKETVISFPVATLEKYNFGEWVKVHFQLDNNSGQIIFSFLDTPIIASCDYHSLKHFHIKFGCCDIPNFIVSDVPPISIRNIRLSTQSTGTRYYWPLKEHHREIVYDSICSAPAQAFNSRWEIDKHIKWVKEKEFSSYLYTQVTYNAQDNCIYFADLKNIFNYHISQNRLDTITPRKGTPYFVLSNQIIYHPYYHELWSYDYDNHHIAHYDFLKNEWDNTDHSVKNPNHTHHNAFIYKQDSSLYTFGGYGDYRYKNEIQRKGRFFGPWDTLRLNPSIPPRYLCSSALLNSDTLLIFGGYGNASGKQELGPQNFYDLYAVDIRSLRAKKIWDIQPGKENFVGGNQMVIDRKRNKLYTLCFSNIVNDSYILLKSFDLSNGKEQSLADTIPYTFIDINSYSTLYYDSIAGKLYAVTIYNHDSQSDVKIYSLAYPPLNAADAYQIAPQAKDSNVMLYLGIALLFFICILMIVLFRKKRKPQPSPPFSSPAYDHLTVAQSTEPVINRKSAFLFFHGFQVLNKRGEDITKLFTPTLKQMLILIVLYSLKNKKGVSDVTLREILWPDKSDEKAQNNRRVCIHKLKVLLEELEGVGIHKEGIYWQLKYTDEFYCDYIRMFQFIEETKMMKDLNISELYGLLNSLPFGQLLPYMQFEWLDPFKSEYADKIIDTLTEISKLKELQEDYKFQICLADALFAFDSVDEYALQMKCIALQCSGKIGMAQTTYTNFCTEYKNILGSDYPKSLKDIYRKKQV